MLLKSSHCPRRMHTARCSGVVDLRPAQGNRTAHRTLALLRSLALLSLLEDVQQRLLSRRIHISPLSLRGQLLNLLLLGLSGLLRRELLSPTETTLSLRSLTPRIDWCRLLREPLGLLELRLLSLGELLLLLLREPLSLLRLLELRLLNLLLNRLLNRLLLVRLSLSGLGRVLVHRELRAGVLRGVELGCAELALFERCVSDVRDLESAADLQSLCAGSANSISDGCLLLAGSVDATEPVVVRILRVALLGLNGDHQLPLGLIGLCPVLQFLGLRVSLLDH